MYSNQARTWLGIARLWIEEQNGEVTFNRVCAVIAALLHLLFAFVLLVATIVVVIIRNIGYLANRFAAAWQKRYGMPLRQSCAQGLRQNAGQLAVLIVIIAVFCIGVYAGWFNNMFHNNAYAADNVAAIAENRAVQSEVMVEVIGTPYVPGESDQNPTTTATPTAIPMIEPAPTATAEQIAAYYANQRSCDIHYTVKPGDTLGAIFGINPYNESNGYDRWEWAKAQAEYNELVDWNMIYVGQVLCLPDHPIQKVTQ
ncbi:MAG: LysM peptidoglycan-binding domain-containing protein [bacterium]|nr:LysM peptidoglycan-binding domain-containing protein [bacterium]